MTYNIPEKSLLKTTFLFMDDVRSMILDGAVDDGMNKLFLELGQLRNSSSDQEWQHFSRHKCLLHPLTDLIHQDPLIYHSYQKPRGYAGDAALLDYIYKITSPSESTTNFGQQIFNCSTATSAASSVRSRRDLVADLIDEITLKATKPPKILSIACGHLRESQKSQAVKEGNVGEFIALDQDSLSIALLKEEQSNNGIFPVCGSVRDILTKKLSFKNLDLVYSAGLYDYLNDKTAARLTRIMFDMLNSGGTLLVANFTPITPDIPYMETFMQWELIYRTTSQLEKVIDEIPANAIAKKDSFTDCYDNVAYLKLTKK